MNPATVRHSADSVPTSTSLIERVKANDAPAWERFSALYTPVVYHWAREKGLQDVDANDMAQEVFIAVHRRIGRFRRDREGDTLHGWLYTITRNKIRDHLRAARVRPEVVGGSEMRQRLSEEPEQLTDDSTLNAPDDVNPLVRSVVELVRAEFESQTWQFFLLRTLERRPAAEIAAAVGATKWTVYQANRRVLKRLREVLAEAELGFEFP
ncbi:MAG TPA: sigma-70 family RNA polymerase sigma factor [Pirellulales bacterium]|nr:sigma-70 family RNA polymerase sigma factor [Pirellulales bacterium]